jgi:hypothetical protein
VAGAWPAAPGHRRVGLAQACLTAALDIWQELRLPLWQARTLDALGSVHHEQGCEHQALAAWSQARVLFRALNAPEVTRQDDKSRNFAAVSASLEQQQVTGVPTDAVEPGRRDR